MLEFGLLALGGKRVENTSVMQPILIKGQRNPGRSQP